jgi:adenylylsulfate kinase
MVRGLFPQTGFTRAERDEHIRRLGFLASRLEQQGICVVAATVSPYADSRDFVRRL